MNKHTTEPTTLWGRFWGHLWSECDSIALWLNKKMGTRITGKQLFLIAAALVMLGAIALVFINNNIVLPS